MRNKTLAEMVHTYNTAYIAYLANNAKATPEKAHYYATKKAYGAKAARIAAENQIMNSDEYQAEKERTDVHVLNVSEGNAKLIPTTKGKPVTLKPAKGEKPAVYLTDDNGDIVIADKTVKYLIWNTEALLTCRCHNGEKAGLFGATNACISACYADGSARVYGYNVIHSRMVNFAAAVNPMFEKNMIATIDYYMAKKSYAGADQVVFRIHESGEFFSLAYTAAWFRIMAYCKEKYPSLVFNYYTKSIDFIEKLGYDQARIDSELPNAKGRASVWADSSAEFLACVKRNGYRVYTAIETFPDTLPEVNRCHCKSCATCGKCISDTGLMIVEIH